MSSFGLVHVITVWCNVWCTNTDSVYVGVRRLCIVFRLKNEFHLIPFRYPVPLTVVGVRVVRVLQSYTDVVQCIQ